MAELNLNPDRLFDPDPSTRTIARNLYELVKNLPLVCPHGHVEARIFANENYRFPNPTLMIVTPDHYVTRMLHSQGIDYEELGLPSSKHELDDKEARRIWKIFADNFYLFAGTPSGLWINQELHDVFGIKKKLNSETAMEIYDAIDEKLRSPEFSPRALYDKFGIEVLCTTDGATGTLEYHKSIREFGWHGNIRPTFRPDSLINRIHREHWRESIGKLREITNVDVKDYNTFVEALEKRRSHFKDAGAVATDHSMNLPIIQELGEGIAKSIFDKALLGNAKSYEADKFSSHMLSVMTEMSIRDGLVMQLHPGSYRNHDHQTLLKFGTDIGADIPIDVKFTRNLEHFLNKYGNHPNFTFVIFTLDESTYSRELAPLAGYYSSVRLGPPWWFFDSPKGIERYLDAVAETAGIYNLAGFNDDTRAFPSIPARHDVWRRVAANWVAKQVAKSTIDMDDATKIMMQLAYELAKKTYKL